MRQFADIDNVRAERIVRDLMARIAAPTAQGLAQSQHYAPVIDSVDLYVVFNGEELKLGPDAVPAEEGPSIEELRLGLVPLGQPCLAVISARLAVNSDVLLPGARKWKRLTGDPPWRVPFSADAPGGKLVVIARNAAHSQGVREETFPLRVAPELNLQNLQFPGFTPMEIAALTTAIGNSRPTELRRPSRTIEQGTRELLGASLAPLADLQTRVKTAIPPNPMPRVPTPINAELGPIAVPNLPSVPKWPKLDLPPPDLPPP